MKKILLFLGITLSLLLSSCNKEDNSSCISGGYGYTSSGHPAGATAICNDGTYSYSQNRRGTCSHHGGVREWLD